MLCLQTLPALKDDSRDCSRGSVLARMFSRDFSSRSAGETSWNVKGEKSVSRIDDSD